MLKEIIKILPEGVLILDNMYQNVFYTNPSLKKILINEPNSRNEEINDDLIIEKIKNM